MNFQIKTNKVQADPVVVECYGRDGETIARPGDWWVRHPDGRQEFLSPVEFGDRYEPIPLAAPEIISAIKSLAGQAAFVPYADRLYGDMG